MHYDLESVRQSYGLCEDDFAALIGKSVSRYISYEIKQEIPCKYVYVLWKKLPNFPIPDDFFHYTSFVLNVNMRYHKLKQEDVAEMFGMRQATISSYFLGTPIPMYELKELFLKNFNPFIIPCIKCKGEDNQYHLEEITELDCRGDFLANKKKVSSRRKNTRKKQKKVQTSTNRENRKKK